MSYAPKAQKPVDVEKLERSLVWALKNGLPAGELVAMLRPLVRHTCPSSKRGVLARIQLAEQLLACPGYSPGRFNASKCAWEAASLLHRVLAELAATPHENTLPSASASEFRARALAAFGMACSILGHYRAAKRAYLRALSEDPADAVAAHNLGHLLATRLNAPAASLVWLQKAHAGLPENHEVAASLSHALVLNGQCERAVAILARVTGSKTHAHRWVQGWLRQANPTTERAAAGE